MWTFFLALFNDFLLRNILEDSLIRSEKAFRTTPDCFNSHFIAIKEPISELSIKHQNPTVSHTFQIKKLFYLSRILLKFGYIFHSWLLYLIANIVFILSS